MSLCYSGGMEWELERFIETQEDANSGYACALREVAHGKKTSHWIWYIFPQPREFGRSEMAHFYGLSSLAEARAYGAHPVLGARLREIAAALLQHAGRAPQTILGTVDAMKVHSCMTVFAAVAPQDVFDKVLAAFYDARPCTRAEEWVSFCKACEQAPTTERERDGDD